MDRVQAMTVFVKVVESGSLSGAARALGLSLPSVSRYVAGLEERFGARLLARTTRQLALTESGRLYYERAKRILGEIDDAELVLTAQAAVPSGRLHVSAPTLIGRLRLAALLPNFLARYPQIAVDLTLLDRPVSPVEEGIDVAIRVGRLEDSSMIARKLGTVRMVVCAAPAYLERRGEPQRPEELRDHDCLVFAAGAGADEWRFQGLPGRKAAVRVVARLRANMLDAVVAAALGGAGLVRAPSWQVAEHVASGQLKIVLAPFERPSSPIHAIFSHARPLPPKVRAFTDFLVERWAEEGDHNLVPTEAGQRVRKDKARGRGRAIRT